MSNQLNQYPSRPSFSFGINQGQLEYGCSECGEDQITLTLQISEDIFIYNMHETHKLFGSSSHIGYALNHIE